GIRDYKVTEFRRVLFRSTVHVGGAEMDEALDWSRDGGCHQVLRAADIDAGDLIDRGPIGYQRAAVEDDAAAIDGAEQRLGSLQVTHDDVDVQCGQLRGVTGGPHQAPHLPPVPHQPLSEVAADEPARAGDQAVSRLMRTGACRPAHLSEAAARRRIVARAIS